jgi:hypothetical protein
VREVGAIQRVFRHVHAGHLGSGPGQPDRVPPDRATQAEHTRPRCMLGERLREMADLGLGAFSGGFGVGVGPVVLGDVVLVPRHVRHFLVFTTGRREAMRWRFMSPPSYLPATGSARLGGTAGPAGYLRASELLLRHPRLAEATT